MPFPEGDHRWSPAFPCSYPERGKENVKVGTIYRTGDRGQVYTTKELKTPTAKTRNNHKLKPEKTTPLFSDQPFGDAKTTGTPTTKAKETKIKANKAN